MTEPKVSEHLADECAELTRALAELLEWSAERKRVLEEFEGYIQQALSTNKMTLRKNSESGCKLLSERMIATLALDCNMVKRSILMMRCRERQIRKRLAELTIGSSSSPSDDSFSSGGQKKSA